MPGNGADGWFARARRGEPILSHTLPNDACGEMNLSEGTALEFEVEPWERGTISSGSKSR